MPPARGPRGETVTVVAWYDPNEVDVNGSFAVHAEVYAAKGGPASRATYKTATERESELLDDSMVVTVSTVKVV